MRTDYRQATYDLMEGDPGTRLKRLGCYAGQPRSQGQATRETDFMRMTMISLLA
jgi:hypothetical protein